MAALMLVPVASASAIFYSGNIKVNIAGTGSGEVKSRPDDGFYHQSSPPIACSYNGVSTSGNCEGEVAEVGEAEEEEERGFFYVSAQESIAGPGSELSGWTVQKGQYTGNNCPPSSKPNRCVMGGNEEGEDELEVLATFCLEGTATKEFVEEKGGIPFYAYGCEESTTPNLALNVEEGSGTVVSNPAGLECTGSAPKTCEAELAEGKVTLTASPAPGYLVKSWKGCDTGGVTAASARSPRRAR